MEEPVNLLDELNGIETESLDGTSGAFTEIGHKMSIEHRFCVVLFMHSLMLPKDVSVERSIDLSALFVDAQVNRSGTSALLLCDRATGIVLAELPAKLPAPALSAIATLQRGRHVRPSVRL